MKCVPNVVQYESFLLTFSLLLTKEVSFKLIFNVLSLRLLLQYNYLTFTVRCRVHTAARIQRHPPSWSGIANKKGSKE